MFIPVLQGEEIENEVDIFWCCSKCVIERYNWTPGQYAYVKNAIEENKPIPVPLDMMPKGFAAYIKSVKL